MGNNINKLVLEERSLLEISGVKDVENYNEEVIEVITSIGVLTICGSEFNIIKLDVESGEMKISGKVDSIYYTDNSEKRNSILKRLFK